MRLILNLKERALPPRVLTAFKNEVLSWMESLDEADLAECHGLDEEGDEEKHLGSLISALAEEVDTQVKSSIEMHKEG